MNFINKGCPANLSETDDVDWVPSIGNRYNRNDVSQNILAVPRTNVDVERSHCSGENDALNKRKRSNTAIEEQVVRFF